MKPIFESIGSTASTSFLVRRFEEKSFSAPYHFHPENELTLIKSGRGKRYVGTHVDDYYPGDLVLLGGNLPHCWKTENAAEEQSVSIVVHFHSNFLGTDLFCRPEMQAISQLLNNSHYGLRFSGDNTRINEQLEELLQQADPFKKMMLLLWALYELASAKTYTILDSQSAFSGLSVGEKERINAVIAYIVENFQHKVSLTKAASLAHMTPHAFCKYFKKVTRKTFMEAVTDYRIDFAGKQLINTEKSVAQIGFESGFNDISNFHKTFKHNKKLSPLNYRNAFLKKTI